MSNHEVRVPSILMDLIPEYLENRRLEINVLTEALEKKDFSVIQDIGHKLKGNAGSYGFSFLTEVGLNLEKAARSQDKETIETMLDSYLNYLNKVKILPA